MKIEQHFKNRNCTQEQFIETVKASGSIRQILIALNLKPSGANYRSVHMLIDKLNLDTSHFHGQLWNKGKQLPLKVAIEKYLSNEKPIQSNSLRKRLLRENILQSICDCCKNDTWNDKPIPLELHHKDGNHSNNNLSNLQLLCPNCHAQTDTYRGKNKKN